MYKLNSLMVLLLLSAFIISDGISQQVITPRPSPDATVSQMVGVTKITVDYSSPGVKGRKIWGELVPFGQVWRTGANEATTITFDDPVMVNGNRLEAGTYGLLTIPGATEWEIIFSGDTEVDGSSQFDEKKEKLRLKVTPKKTQFVERMMFAFTNTSETSTEVNLYWEELGVSFKVEAATQELTLSKARSNLSWTPSMQAAQYCLQNNVNLEEGLRWAEASVLLEKVYWNMRIKAQILEKLGQKEEAISIMDEAIALGSKMESAPFDFENMKKIFAEWKSN